MNQIPKVIHYCWFGGGQMPDLAEKCIESWKTFFPGYEIKRWDEFNFNIEICPYVEEAYQAKKWAFVSDYARFWILYHEGGVYFDTDVEVIKSFSDIIERGAFMGCEKSSISYDQMSLNRTQNICNTMQAYGVAPGLGLGAVPGLDLYKKILEYYETQHFIEFDGSLNLETVVKKITQILIKCGYDPYSGKLQEVEEVWIYPPDFFCPMNCQTGQVIITDNTHSIHHYMASWFNSADKIVMKIGRAFSGKGRIAYKISRICDFPFRVWAKFDKLGFKNAIWFIRNKLVK